MVLRYRMVYTTREVGGHVRTTGSEEKDYRKSVNHSALTAGLPCLIPKGSLKRIGLIKIHLTLKKSDLLLW